MLPALAHCTTEWLARVPCDTPDFPLDLVPRLAAALLDQCAAAACRGRLILRAEALPPLPCPMRACKQELNSLQARDRQG